MSQPQDPNNSGQPGSPYGTPPPQYGAAPPPPQPQQATKPPMPPIVNYASMVLFVLVALQVLSSIVALANMQAAVDRALNQAPSAGNMTQEQIASFARMGIVVAAVIGFVFAALFLWLTFMVRKGRNWARITSTVFLALGIIFGLVGLGSGPAIAMLIGIVMLILEIAVLIMLWQKASNAYFSAAARPAHY